MTSNTKRNAIQDSVAETVADADKATLRDIVDFVQRELAERRRDLLDVDPKPGEEVVGVSEERGYTRVVLRQPCAEGCDDCPHGPYRYHVRTEQSPEREDSLPWSFLGRVFDAEGSTRGVRPKANRRRIMDDQDAALFGFADSVLL
jgi:hypothetical protein